MVRAEYQDSIGTAPIGNRTANPINRPVHIMMQPVVGLAIAFGVALICPTDQRCRAVRRVVAVAVGRLQRRFGGEVFVVGG